MIYFPFSPAVVAVPSPARWCRCHEPGLPGHFAPGSWAGAAEQPTEALGSFKMGFDTVQHLWLFLSRLVGFLLWICVTHQHVPGCSVNWQPSLRGDVLEARITHRGHLGVHPNTLWFKAPPSLESPNCSILLPPRLVSHWWQQLLVPPSPPHLCQWSKGVSKGAYNPFAVACCSPCSSTGRIQISLLGERQFWLPCPERHDVPKVTE